MAPLAYRPLPREALLVRWTELRRDPRTPPYSELNEYGEILVPPLHPIRGHIVAELVRQVEAQLGGEAGDGPAVLTRYGVRRPDVGWMANVEEWDRLSQHPAFPVAPTICIEVVCPGKRRQDLNRKLEAYLQAFAEEVIFLELDNGFRFFDQDGERSESAFGLHFIVPAGLA